MLQFNALKDNVNLIKNYLQSTSGGFCDLSLGVKYMWRDDFVISYAIYNDTLIMMETCTDYENAFYYPIGADVDGALCQIEEYVKKNNMPLVFCCLDNFQASILATRYYQVTISNDRDWSDYIYDAEKFKTYSGKKFSGQRNHVNKFKKLYPNYSFKQIERQDFDKIKEFLQEFNNRSEFLRWSESVEQKKVFDLVENMFEFNQVGGLIQIGEKVVAFSIGEVIGDTLIVHVEKALTKYEGVYPLMAQEFAKHFALDGVKKINREEDCGDTGLRISKLQYQPIEIKEKNLLVAKTLFDKISTPVLINCERLTITDINETDKETYKNLYVDDLLNKWWGYDYREDLGINEPTAEYFYNFQNSLKEKKEEYSLAVRLSGEMIGELVLHNFDYFGGVEMGFRFFKKYQGNGYAFESASALKEYAKSLGAKVIKSRHCRENIRSKNLINKLGLEKYKEDEKCCYYKCEL